MPPILELQNLSRRVPGRDGAPFVIFDGIDLAVRDGEFLSIVGPSGCGKTTLLRVVNGLVPPSGGRIFVDGREQQGAGGDLVMGFVFQGAALLPWRTSLSN
ncbi:MAG TPA: ATP-binding cassette domain-containing protein, partial [Candidatus Binatia bacterium]